MYNLVVTMKKRDPEIPLKNGEYSIFDMTSVIALATNKTAGDVMLDYLEKYKEMEGKK